MRELNTGTKKYTKVEVLDEKGQGNANHEYQVIGSKPIPPDNVAGKILGTVSFQNGPIKEVGVNGVMNEDLMAIVIDRLEGFQSGSYECSENQTALEHMRAALEVSNDRTAKREKRGVEGTHTL